MLFFLLQLAVARAAFVTVTIDFYNFEQK